MKTVSGIVLVMCMLVAAGCRIQARGWYEPPPPATVTVQAGATAPPPSSVQVVGTGPQVGTGVTVVEATCVQGGQEACNGIDDNCNGVVDDGTSTACASAEAIGGVVTGTSASRTGFVAAPAGSERWYSVGFIGTGGTPSISLSGATASLRIEVYTACGGTPFCSGTPGTAWSFTDNTAGTGFYTRAVAWPTTAYVRIYRTSATTTCGSYTLNVSR